MAHSKTVRDKVRQLYIEGMALKPAATAAAVSYDSAKAWKAAALNKGDNWDSQRAAFSISTGNVDDVTKRFAIKVVQQSLKLSEEIDNSDHDIETKVKLHASMADAMAKTTKGIKRFSPELMEASAAIGTLKIIIDYLRTNDLELLKNLSEHFDEIGNLLREAYGTN